MAREEVMDTPKTEPAPAPRTATGQSLLERHRLQISGSGANRVGLLPPSVTAEEVLAIEAEAAAPTEGLDVERLTRAYHAVATDNDTDLAGCEHAPLVECKEWDTEIAAECKEWGTEIAAEYARLATPEGEQ